MLGRKVTIQSARLKMIGGPYLSLNGMTVEETNEFGGGVFLQADQVRANFGVFEFLRSRNLTLDTLTLTSPKIHLIKNEQGVWNWTTLGDQRSANVAAMVSVVLNLLSADLSKTSLNGVSILNGSVTLTDRTAAQQQDSRYNKIELNAQMRQSGSNRHATGEMIVRSDETDGTELLKASLPFDLEIAAELPLNVSGSLGPGPIETRNLSIADFVISGEVSAASGSRQLAGKGKISADDMFIPTINISEQVAQALKLEQIGDMSSGSHLAHLETDFQLSKDVITTPGLRIQQLDGLGDASAQSGSFNIESALTVNYAASITLNSNATSRVKSASSMLGILVTILETNNQLSVPISIVGDVRKPQIQVDVSRIF
jgi:uncharacterized protein involved in outer membrane biogenesis